MQQPITYEALLTRMLQSVPNDVDKREGSIIYDALAPVAVELVEMYNQLDIWKDNVALDTATGDMLTELCYQNGTFRKPATKAIVKGVFNMDVPLQSRFSGENNTYIVLEKLADFEYTLQCEQEGERGNTYLGSILPLQYIEGLQTATITAIITNGVEEESDDALRERNREKIIQHPQDGNIAQYEQWTKRFDDVGAAKVFPLWSGGNTVKVVITDRDYKPASSTLINEVQQYLDPNAEGLGNGVAPIGAKVTVATGIEKPIDITGTITLEAGYSEAEGVEEMISDYLASITFVKHSVSYMRTAVAILDSPNIADMQDLKINGTATDVALHDEEIPILNSVNLTVVNT
ncbi:baseplate J/gp47 family protein [Longirhabdus pacifica]|uniref:baseplate J/gp47 family protein n=1 Tax=Longirhabdus pacifica TaxID=2305227 RepID=UPI001008CC59|nr:baseplate J/gp47 family protein [Longirhabdus pacifica]